MGIFDFFKRKSSNLAYARTMNGYSPIFSQFGDNIYSSDVVQQAISCIVCEMKKLNPTHVCDNGRGTDCIPVSGAVQSVLNHPNPLMTTSEFIEKITWNLFLNYNSFVLPTWNNDTLSGLYPLQPSQVTFLEDPSGRIAVEMKFNNGYSTIVKYSDLIHMKYKYSVNDFMGGNQSGQPDNTALLKTLSLNDTLLQGVAKSMKASFAVNGIVKYNTMLDDGLTAANIAALDEKINHSETGFLPLDLKGEFIPLQKQIQFIDDTTLKFIDEKILRHFGVPLPILTGDYTKEQYEAFYQKTLEPLIISMSQAFTRGIFTERQSNGFGNRIVFYSKELIFMSTDQKLEMIRLLGDSGGLYENEKRVMFGLKPLPELEGIRKQSLNYVDVTIANDYQTMRAREALEKEVRKSCDTAKTTT